MNLFFGTSQQESTLLNGLMGYWVLNATSGTNEPESLGLSDATVGSATVGATGILSYGVHCTGANNYISAAYNNLQPGGAGITLSSWIYMHNLPSGVTRHFEICYAANAFRMELPDDGNYARLYLRGSDAGVAEFETATKISFATNTWYHLCFSNSGIGATAKMWVNGIDRFSWHSAHLTDNIAAYTTPFYLTNRGNTITTYIDGIIDEVGIWNRELTTDEVSTLYNSGAGKTYPF
jgi:hypothetical protein